MNTIGSLWAQQNSQLSAFNTSVQQSESSATCGATAASTGTCSASSCSSSQMADLLMMMMLMGGGGMGGGGGIDPLMLMMLMEGGQNQGGGAASGASCASAGGEWATKEDLASDWGRNNIMVQNGNQAVWVPSTSPQYNAAYAGQMGGFFNSSDDNNEATFVGSGGQLMQMQ